MRKWRSEILGIFGAYIFAIAGLTSKIKNDVKRFFKPIEIGSINTVFHYDSCIKIGACNEAL
jgi:hypothetical protein